jgi:hypothetical protein
MHIRAPLSEKGRKLNVSTDGKEKIVTQSNQALTEGLLLGNLNLVSRITKTVAEQIPMKKNSNSI